MTTFRAAYIPSDSSSTSGGFLLTSADEQHLPDAELLAIAQTAADEWCVEGGIVIGDWVE